MADRGETDEYQLRPQLLAQTVAGEAAIVEYLRCADWEPAPQYIARVEAYALRRADRLGKQIPMRMVDRDGTMSPELLRYLSEPARQTPERRQSRRLANALGHLESYAPKQVAVLVGVYVDGKSQAAIAAEQGMSEPAVSKVKQKAEAYVESRFGERVWEMLPHGDRRIERSSSRKDIAA
jgi:hypothetical protein